jgi:hypothetical protein
MLALLCALTAVMVNPLVRDPARMTVGGEGDNLYGMRQLWWVKHALVDLQRSPYFDPESAYPGGYNLARGEMFPATTIPAIPLTMAFGPVVAYNVCMFLTFVLMGLGTYLWVRGLTGSGGGAVVAGIIAAFLPYRMAHVLGHLDITGTHWMPWALLAFERFLVSKTAARATVLGLAVGMVMLSAWYYAYSVSLVLPVYAIIRTRPWREHWDARWWRGLAVAALVVAVMITPFLIPYVTLKMQGGLTRGLGDLEFWSLNVYSFFLPNRLNPVWSGFMERNFLQDTAQWVERGVALGYTAIALAVFAIVRRPWQKWMWAVAAVWVASFLIALGPTVHWGDQMVTIPVPAAVSGATAWLLPYLGESADTVGYYLRPRALPIPLPSFFLYLFVPLTSGMRVMARFGVWTGLMTAALAGCGTAMLIAALRRREGSRPFWPAMAVLAICGLVLAESYSRLPALEIRTRAVDQWLDQQPPGSWAVVELPLSQTRRFFQDYYKTVHQRPTLFASPAMAFPAATDERRQAALATFPSPEAVAMLRECRVRYVLFTPAEIPEWPALKAQIEATDGIAFDREVEGIQVYVMTAGEP